MQHGHDNEKGGPRKMKNKNKTIYFLLHRANFFMDDP